MNMQSLYEKNLNEEFRLTVQENPWIPLTHRTPQPNGKGLSPQQERFLLLDCAEALYGGAAGGGKSDALLMAALQYVDVPGYSAIIFRRTYKALALPKALIDRSKEWLNSTKAHWSEEHKMWTFPSGATVCFGYLDNPGDKWQYQSAEFQMVGFDELTQFLVDDYRYLFSRLRRLSNSDIPLRMRSASNPGNIGHDWVKQRFMIEGDKYGRVFVPAKLDDNKNLDRQSYIESLKNLDPITLRQYLDGDWTARHGGQAFKREKFEIVPEAPADLEDVVRYWDKAATKPKENSDPDYTVGVKLGIKQGLFYILDVVRFRGPPQQVELIVKQTAQLDGKKTRVFIEQEPGSAGVESIDHYAREVLVGFNFTGIKTTGSKAERAGPFASAANAGSESAFGNMKLVQGSWLNNFLDELEGFPIGSHDDQVDATSGAFQQLTVKFGGGVKFIEW